MTAQHTYAAIREQLRKATNDPDFLITEAELELCRRCGVEMVEHDKAGRCPVNEDPQH